MRKEIAPEQFNYNKFPGPDFVAFEDVVKSEDLTFKLVENYKNAFNATVFSQKFSEILLKYDYIVGDWGNEQLRLKGFYAEDKVVQNQLKTSHIDIYLKEYCNFGCAYFILENPEPRDLPKEEDSGRRRRRDNRKRRNNRNRRDGAEVRLDREAKTKAGFEKRTKSQTNQKDQAQRERQHKKRRARDKRAYERQEEADRQGLQGHFVIRKKQN